MNRIPIIAIANQGGLSQPVSEKQVNLLAKAIAEGSGRGVIAINLDTIQDANQLREILSGALNPTKKLPKLGGTDEIGFGGRQLVVSVTGTRLLPVMTQIINDQEFEHQNQKVTLANTIVVSTGATVEGFSKQLSSRDFYRASLVIDGDAEFKVALEEELTQRGLRGTRLEDALTDEGVKKFKDEVRRIYLEIDGAATEEAVKKFDEKFRVTPEALRLAFSYPGSLCHMTNALME
jgi:hypothetical protein